MEKFTYINAKNVEQVPSLLSGGKWGETMIIAGGTDLLGELKEYIQTPKKLIKFSEHLLRRKRNASYQFAPHLGHYTCEGGVSQW